MIEPIETTAERVEVAPPRLADIPVLLFIRGLSLVTLVLGLVVGAHWYIGVTLIDAPGLPGWVTSALWLALWGSFLSIFGGFLGGRLFPTPLARVLQWVGFVWMGLFGLLLTGVLASDLVLFVASKVTVVDASWQAWRALAVLAVVVPTLTLGFFAARAPKVRRVELEVKGLGRELDGLKVVQLSDLHIGETLGRAFAERVTKAVNALSPDVIAVTGDMVDGSPHNLASEVAPFAALSARFGVFFVTGNHEYYHGVSAWEAHARRLGMTVLHNEHRVIQVGDAKLVVAGVPDLEGARFSASHAPDADATFAGAPQGAPRLLLAHQPRYARAVAAHDVSLMLAGHTHGGQIFPFMFFVRLQQPVLGGLAHIAGVRTWTSSGTGYWGPPFRVGARGEITELTLRAERPST